MYTQAKLMMLVCESPLHAGTGSELDFIDNPIQRERHTNFPKIEGSSLKGAMRQRFRQVLNNPTTEDTNEIKNAFGPDNPLPNDARQGSLGFTDARLLLFPVKSAKGVFAWVTCPKILHRLQRDLQIADPQTNLELQLNDISDGICRVFSKELTISKKLVLEEYAFDAKQATDKSIARWLANNIFPNDTFWNNCLQNQFVILSDTDFTDFVELTTEVITRNKIDPATGTVSNGLLFTEEYLPENSVLYALAMSHAEFANIRTNEKGEPERDRKTAKHFMDFFIKTLTKTCHNRLQIGGNATIGKGIVRTVLHDANTKNEKNTSKI